MSVTDPSTAPEPVRDPVTNRRLDHRLTYGLLGLGVFVVLVVYVVWQTYPNYDTYYTLVWGKELANGHLPDYDVFRTPTPHPLSTLVAWVMAPFGTASDRILVLLSLFGLLGFYVVTFVFTERLLGRVIALLAVAVMVTRTDMQLLALRAMFDLPFYLMIFGAALLELRRPRCGWPVLLVLALAGLLRPEAWLLAGVYWLYLVPTTSRPLLIRYALLVAAAPVLWLLADLIVTGEPLYSFTSTREVSGEFGRNRGVGDAIRSIPNFLGGNDRIVTVGIGGLGLLVAVYILRRRALLPLALGGLGLLTFLIIAAGGLSVIPRYLTIPSLLLSLCVAVALGGWRLIHEPTARKVAIGIAILSALVLAWRAPYYVRDYQKLARPGDVHRGAAQGAEGDPERAERGPRAAGLPPDHRPDALGDPDHPLRDGAAEGGRRGVDRPAPAADAGRAADRRHVQLRAERGAGDELQPEHLRAQALVEQGAARLRAARAAQAVDRLRTLSRSARHRLAAAPLASP